MREPYFLPERHEVRVGDYNDLDWTIREDWTEEVRLREVRNELIMDKLREGKTVCCRSSGWPLYPRVRPNDLCVYVPVFWEDQVSEGDIVFCKVWPAGWLYAHLVSDKEWSEDAHRYKYWISNLAGKTMRTPS